jgi:hypothetical protein
MVQKLPPSKTLLLWIERMRSAAPFFIHNKANCPVPETRLYFRDRQATENKGVVTQKFPFEFLSRDTGDFSAGSVVRVPRRTRRKRE